MYVCFLDTVPFMLLRWLWNVCFSLALSSFFLHHFVLIWCFFLHTVCYLAKCQLVETLTIFHRLFLAFEMPHVGQDRNIQYIQPDGKDLEPLKHSTSVPCGSTIILTDACCCQHSAHLSSTSLFPSSLLMWWPLSSPLVSPSSLQSQTSTFFHPVTWSHKMSVTFLSPPTPFSPLSSTSHLSFISSLPLRDGTILSSLASRLDFLPIAMPWMPEGSI